VSLQAIQRTNSNGLQTEEHRHSSLYMDKYIC